MATIGRWSPSKVRDKIIDGTWVSETGYAVELMRPTTVVPAGTGSSATIVGLGSVDFSACTSLSLNNVFTNEFDNYMIVWRLTNSAGQINIGFRLRASGTDATGANYTSQFISANGTTASASRASNGTFADLSNSYATQRAGSTIFIHGPNLAQPTAMRNLSALDLSSALIVDYGATHSLAVAYDGFTWIAPSGTISGNVAVYGLRG